MEENKNNERKKSGSGLIILLVIFVALLGVIAYASLQVLRNGSTVAPISSEVSVPESDRTDVTASEESAAFSAAEAVLSEAEAVLTDSAENAVSGAEPPADQFSLPETAPISDEESQQLLIRSNTDSSFWEGCPDRIIDLLTPNEYSRPQHALTAVHDIVIHYVGNPGTSAKDNRDYFDSLSDGSRSASSHFVIGLEGEIIQCIPCIEVAYAQKYRNYDAISIEVCHPDEEGKFTDETYDSVVKLTAWLCKAFEIGPEHVIRHYDVTEKECPKYYVDHPDAWEQLLADVRTEYIRLLSA